MIIFDRELAFMTRRNDRLGAVVVREPSVVHFLYELFEQLWSQAQPFSDAATDGLEAVAKDLDRTILRLLASGLKDETIARRLGMSLRTTRKHIADMMQALGAESRFQAGCRGVREGAAERRRRAGRGTHDSSCLIRRTPPGACAVSPDSPDRA